MKLLLSVLLLFQTPSPAPLATPHVPERTPALFTLIYVGGFALIILIAAWRLVTVIMRRADEHSAPADGEVRE